MSKLKQLILFSIFLLCSCGLDNPKNDNFNEFRESIKLNNEKEANLIKKYNSIQLGNNELKFTYQIQALLNDTNKVISISGYIRDIIQIHEDYILKIVTEFMDKHYIVEILVPNHKYERIKSQLETKSPNLNGTFVFKPKSVRLSSLLSMEPEVDYGETRNDDETSLSYQFDGTIYVIKGVLIDYYLNQRALLDKND